MGSGSAHRAAVARGYVGPARMKGTEGKGDDIVDGSADVGVEGDGIVCAGAVTMTPDGRRGLGPQPSRRTGVKDRTRASVS